MADSLNRIRSVWCLLLGDSIVIVLFCSCFLQSCSVMETSNDIADLASVSFDFETKSSHTANSRVGNNEVALPEPNATACCYSRFRQAKQDISLDLALGHKTESLFAADQTPTPTRLIKNCDEVGLFEDLQHVNPFDIGFQRAVDGHVGSATPTNAETAPTNSDSLHTPHVFPLDSTAVVSAVSSADNSCLDETEAQVEEILATKITEAQPACNRSSLPSEVPVPQAVAVQFLQPQVITLVLPAQTISVEAAAASRPVNSGIPVQTVRPFILPKASTASSTAVTANKVQTTAVVPSAPAAHEPSSASLTPTSQLPIKERLKAILNSNNKQRELTAFSTTKYAAKQTAAFIRSEDCMERRRAAASRYRDKMRNEHKELKRLNAQLQQDNRQLRKHIGALEGKLRAQMQLHNDNSFNGNHLKIVPDHMQAPPSSIHLVINMPKILVPSDVQQTIT